MTVALGRGASTRTCLTVMAEGSNGVHLAVADPTEPVPRATLCQEPVAAAHPTARFQERGCRRCAEVGLDQGIAGIRDHGATISLERFYARTGGRGHGRSGVPPTGASRIVPPQQPPSA